ncbi:restriction endonuclease subunit S [Streptomyces antibioticus]|uniref:restriction endonuclease subunit S n=1 Tax=Streptomyces antibioticus TaxID=1890 RepID=UPI0033D9C534
MPNEVRLGDVLKLERIAVQVDPEAEYRQIGIRSFGNGIFHRDPCLGSELSKLKYFEVRPGRLVVSNIMAWEGAIAVSTEVEDGFVGSARFLSYRPIGEVDLRYLNYFFQGDTGKTLIKSVSTGTVTRNQTVSPKNFENAVVQLPDLPEQNRVADKLDGLLMQHGHATDEVPSPQTVRQLAAAGLERSLNRWADETIRVDQVCSMVNDTVHPGGDLGQASEFVGLEHVVPHFGQRIGSRPLGDEKGRKFRFAPGDILYGYLRPYLNKVWLADRHGLCSVEQYVLRPNGTMPAELIAAGLRSKSTLDKVLDATHNLQLPRLRSGLLMAMEIPVVPQKHQKQAMADVEEFNQQIITLAERQRHRETLLTALRPALLDAAFSGRL